MLDVVPELPDIINLSETPINSILFFSPDIRRTFQMTVSGKNVFIYVDRWLIQYSMTFTFSYKVDKMKCFDSNK